MLIRRLASTFTAKPVPSSRLLPPTIRQLLAAPVTDGTPVTISGWIKSIRKQKNVAFAVLTDGSSPEGLQAVFTGHGDNIKGLTNGAAVQLTGKLLPSPGAGQEKELLVELGTSETNAVSAKSVLEKGTTAGKVQLLGKCDPETYPIQKKALSNEYLRDHIHLRARTDAIASMIRLRNGLRKNIGSFFDKQGFIYADTPIITGNDAEGAGEAFEIAKIAREHPAWQADPSSSKDSQSITPVDFFSRPAHLTVSHQLHLEALATALSRVYTLAPCFRAEPSLTGRHLAEFWMMEAEWVVNAAETQGGDGKQVSDLANFVEGCLRDVVGGFVTGNNSDMDVLWKGGDELKRRSLEEAFSSTTPWTRMSYTSAVRHLEEHNNSLVGSQKFKYEPKWGWPLQSEHERWIAEKLVRGPVFITDYPSAIKPFYMRVNDEGSTVACLDLIVPYVGELVGGSVREERVEILDEWANVGAETNAEEYKWYLDLRRYGGAPHVGFGMGFERLVSWVGGIDNIRECVPMPRWAGRMLL